jgi:hypothetical protein
MKQSETKKVAEVAKKYHCETCDYFTSKKSNYIKHLSTDNHQKRLLETNLKQNETKVGESSQKVGESSKKVAKDNLFICTRCDANFGSRSTLWRHNNKCVGKSIINDSDDNKDKDELEFITKIVTCVVKEISQQNIGMMKEIAYQNTDMIKEIAYKNTDMIKELANQNTIIVEKVCELSKEKSITTNNNTNTNNSHNTNTNNNNFNLNFFLNETCKNAMNMSEFIENLNPQISDLEAMSYLGFAKGTSRIFLNGLKNMDKNQKPIHCSDLKREVFYIKEANKWEKDSDNHNQLLIKSIKQIVNKNIKNIIQWQKLYPEYNDPDSKQNDIYNKIILQSMAGSSREETNKNMDKVFKIIAKETIIEKETSE